MNATPEHHTPQPEPCGPPTLGRPDSCLFDLAIAHLSASPEDAAESTTADHAAGVEPAVLREAIRQIQRWASLEESFSDSYDAYFSLGSAIPADVRSVDDHLRRHAGFATDRASFIALQLERLGLATALANLRHEYGMREDDIAWNEDALWAQLSERLHIVEGFGGIHGFRR